MFISFLYMFWATMCPSSGELTVSMRHLVFVTLCGWLPGLQTRQSSTQSDKYQVSHRYSYFSWWWAHSRPKPVEKINKHSKKNCAPSWPYLQDYTRMHGQKNIKKPILLSTHVSREHPNGRLSSGFETKFLYALYSSSVFSIRSANPFPLDLNTPYNVQ